MFSQIKYQKSIQKCVNPKIDWIKNFKIYVGFSHWGFMLAEDGFGIPGLECKGGIPVFVRANGGGKL